jgi:hypothetical protein
MIPRLVGVAARALVALTIGAATLAAIHVGIVEAIVPAVDLAVAAVVAWRRRDRTARLATEVARGVRPAIEPTKEAPHWTRPIPNVAGRYLAWPCWSVTGSSKSTFPASRSGG